jgi:hypothetical protein
MGETEGACDEQPVDYSLTGEREIWRGGMVYSSVASSRGRSACSTQTYIQAFFGSLRLSSGAGR